MPKINHIKKYSICKTVGDETVENPANMNYTISEEMLVT